MDYLEAWSRILYQSSKVTNVKLVTKDKKEKYSHKLFLATINETFNSVLVDHDSTSDTVIIFPDTTLEELELERSYTIGRSDT